MKLKDLLTCTITGLLFCTSCIKDEAPNAEADILSCIVPEDILRRDPIIENDRISLMVKAETDLTQQAPQFTLTEGATIEPASGTMRDFTAPQYYTVTSEDGKWKKKYEVTYIIAGLSTQYHFENVRQSGKYDVLYEVDKNGKETMTWASGNPGYSLTGVPSAPKDFPTVSDNNGLKGKCVKLTTLSTGKFGADLKMPIAAGNLFMGTFNALTAVSNALKATQFGMPFEYGPLYITGYYKYKAGEIFSENGVNVSGKKDECDIYAIFYETDKDTKMLDGTNNFTSPNLVSIARINNPKETEQWTSFYIPFIMQPGKTIDQEKLKKGGYNVAIVFSSSKDGGNFNGAIGSTLYIDEVELIYKSNE